MESRIDPTRDGNEKPFWERLKPVWWLRGIVGAWAFVALLDQLGLVREDWLRVVHALAARWTEWATAVADWLNLQFPLIQIHKQEVTLLAFGTIAWVPVVTGLAWRRWREGRLGTCALYVVALVGSIAFLVGPGHVYDGTLTGLGFSISIAIPMIAAQRESAEPPLVPLAILFVLLCAYYVTTLLGIGNEINLSWLILSFLAPAIAFWLMWSLSREYTKALVVALTFILTLELFNLVPALNEALRPFVDWIDPNGTAR